MTGCHFRTTDVFEAGKKAGRGPGCACRAQGPGYVVQDGQYELHRLLGNLLSMELPVDKKLAIMKKEFDIPLEDDIRRDLDTMCNLGQGIFEKGYGLEEIAEIVEKSVEEVEAIIEAGEPVPA